jgi:hypothetical protein
MANTTRCQTSRGVPLEEQQSTEQANIDGSLYGQEGDSKFFAKM